jgi:NADH-quinone oxidoreductase subunit L
MFRLYFSIFWGEDKQYHHTPHESPLVMTIPLMLLAVGSVFSGIIPFSHLVTADKLAFDTHFEPIIAFPSIFIGLLGIGVAWIMYKKKTDMPDKIAASLGGLYKTVYNKFYIDEIYLFVTRKILFNIVSQSVAWFDRHIVDGSMNGIANVINLSSKKIRGLQSGQLQQYAAVFVAGALGLLLYVIYLLG